MDWRAGGLFVTDRGAFALRGQRRLLVAHAVERLGAADPGDAVLPPRGGSHILASAPDVPVVDIDSLARVAASENIYNVGSDTAACSNPATADPQSAASPDMMFCGALRFNLDPLHPQVTMILELMLAGKLAKRDPSAPALLEATEREVALDRISAYGILARLADVLAATIIRGCSESIGWIAACAARRSAR